MLGRARVHESTSWHRRGGHSRWRPLGAACTWAPGRGTFSRDGAALSLQVVGHPASLTAAPAALRKAWWAWLSGHQTPFQTHQESSSLRNSWSQSSEAGLCGTSLPPTGMGAGVPGPARAPGERFALQGGSEPTTGQKVGTSGALRPSRAPLTPKMAAELRSLTSKWLINKNRTVGVWGEEPGGPAKPPGFPWPYPLPQLSSGDAGEGGDQRGDTCPGSCPLGEAHARSSAQWLLICSQDLNPSFQAIEPRLYPLSSGSPITTPPCPPPTRVSSQGFCPQLGLPRPCTL